MCALLCVFFKVGRELRYSDQESSIVLGRMKKVEVREGDKKMSQRDNI